MLSPRFNWHCDTDGCCVYVGGVTDYDIWMGACHTQPYDPQVLFVADHGCEYEFNNQAEMDKVIDKLITSVCECPTTLDCNCGADLPSIEARDAMLAAQRFVHTFFPSPLAVALDRLAKGQDL